MSPKPAQPLYCLVEAPGVVKAASGADRELTPGAEVSSALGVSWDELLRAAAGDRELSTRRGLVAIEALRAADDASGSLLLITEELPHKASSLPPPSSTRSALDLTLIAGSDRGARAAVDLALRLAKTPLPIYLAGEEGVGAEVLARAVIDASSGAKARVFHVRVGALGHGLAELAALPSDELRGANVLIDDLQDLDVEQGRNLAREVDRGALADARFIATGRADLRERVLQGSFSRELHTLIRGTTVTLPALRDRDDLDELIARLCQVVGRGSGAEKLPRLELSGEALDLLRAHEWPGNLSELASWIARAAATAAPARVLRPAHFPLEAAESRPARPAHKGLREVAERGALEEALRAAGGNVSLAAKKLGVARSTLYRMKTRHKVEDP